MKKWVEITLLVVLAIIVVYLLAFFYFSRGRVDDAIHKANYCSVDSDCKLVNFGCPFGCGTYVNIKEERGIKEKITFYSLTHQFTKTCLYECLGLPWQAKCNGNTCTPTTCEAEKLYSNYRDCKCPAGSHMIINESGMTCIHLIQEK